MQNIIYTACLGFSLLPPDKGLPWTGSVLYSKVCLLCCACRQEDKLLVWRPEGSRGRGDFPFLCVSQCIGGNPKGCKVLPLSVKNMSCLLPHSSKIEFCSCAIFLGSVGVLKKLRLFLCLRVVGARCYFSVSAWHMKVAAACDSPDCSEWQQVLLQTHLRCASVRLL